MKVDIVLCLYYIDGVKAVTLILLKLNHDCVQLAVYNWLPTRYKLLQHVLVGFKKKVRTAHIYHYMCADNTVYFILRVNDHAKIY